MKPDTEFCEDNFKILAVQRIPNERDNLFDIIANPFTSLLNIRTFDEHATIIV